MIDDQKIDSLRNTIDTIDAKLLHLLVERLSVVHQVGEEKREKGLDVFDPHREERLLKRLVSSAPELLDERAVRNIFAAIVGECRRLEGIAMADPAKK